VIAVRDSKNPDGHRLAFARATFGVLAREIRAGRHDLSSACWRKSSRSDSEGGNCVEVAALPTVIAIRDSKNPDGHHLAFARTAFVALAREIRANQHNQ
jgi:hypothetical protein